MYTRLTRSGLRVELASPAYLGVTNYLNNYFAMNARVTRSRLHVDLAFPAYLVIVII